MSKQDILTVTTLAAHLAIHKPQGEEWDVHGGEHMHPSAASRCAADAMLLQKLGARARRNAAKRWKPPETREPGETVDAYLQECARIGGEVERVVSPYGWHPRDFVVGLDGVTFLCLPGDHAAVFGKGFLI